MNQAAVAINHSHPAAKAAHCLREFQADKPATQHNEMFRNKVQFQRFNMCQRLCFSQTGRWLDGRMGSYVDYDPLPVEHTHPAVSRSDLNNVFGPIKRPAPITNSAPLFL